MMHLRNRDIAELLAREGETAEGHRRRAFRRAARAALSWPAEAADLRSLTELRGVGPYLERVNDERGDGFRVLRAAEMNLTPEGAGDMSPTALARLDLVLGAFHSALRRREDQTARYVAALRNPDVHVLAHPRGRIWNFRTG